MRIRATVRYMAANEISEMIAPGKIAEIKGTGDPNPVFKAFVIGQEGPATGFLFGIGNVVKTWYATAIRALHSRIGVGTKVFQGHAADTNEHEGRIEIGYVVGKKLLMLKDKLSTVVACYLHPPFRNIPLDVASIEVEIGLRRGERGTYVSDVGEVTGIALGNSGIDRPGFSGATLLGTLQAFAKNKGMGGTDQMTLEELRAAIQEGQFRPSDLFEDEVLSTDPFIRAQIRERTKNAEGYRERDYRRTEETLTKTQDEKKALETKVRELESQLKEKDGIIQTSKIASAKSQVSGLFEKAKTDRKLTDRQTKFVKARLDRFEVKKPEELQKEFDAFLDAAILEEKELAKNVFGLKEEEPKQRIPGAEPSEGNEAEPGEEALNPATNPMIPT